MRRGKMVGFQSFSPSFGDGYYLDDYPTTSLDDEEEINANVDYTTLASSALFSLLGRQPNTQHQRTMSHSRIHQPPSAGVNRVRRAETMALPSFFTSLSSDVINHSTTLLTPTNANTPTNTPSPLLSPISRSAPLPSSIQTLNRDRENLSHQTNLLSSSADLTILNPVLNDTSNTPAIDNENESTNNHAIERENNNTLGGDSIFSFEMDGHVNELDPSASVETIGSHEKNTSITQTTATTSTTTTITHTLHNTKKIASSPPHKPDFFSVPKPSTTLGIDDLLVSHPPEWSLCVICCEVFKNPSIIRCGHSFCYDCVKKLINSSSSPRCALCRKKIGGESDINPNYQMKQVISGLIVRCRYAFEPQFEYNSNSNHNEASKNSTGVNNNDSNNPVAIYNSPPSPHNLRTQTTQTQTPIPSNINISANTTAISSMENSSILSLTPTITSQMISSTNNSNNLHDHSSPRTVWKLSSSGCKETLEYGNLLAHEGICGHAPISCFNEGCTLEVKRKDLETHMINCPYRVIRCSCCKELIQFLEEKKHDNICPEKIIHCSLKCGQSYTRKESEQHSKQCPASIIRCPHEKHGCKYEGRNDHLSSHLEACPYESIKDYITFTQEQIQQLTQITRIQNQEIRALQKTVSVQSTELNILKRLLQGRGTLNYEVNNNNTINHNNFSNISSSSNNNNTSNFGSSSRVTPFTRRSSETDSPQKSPTKTLYTSSEPP